MKSQVTMILDIFREEKAREINETRICKTFNKIMEGKVKIKKTLNETYLLILMIS